MKRLNITRRTIVIILLGNLLWFALALFVFMLCVLFRVTAIGEFVEYNLELISQSKNADAIIEDPQWGVLLERFQSFLGMILEPLVTLVVAFGCALAQKDRKLLTTYLATLLLPTFLMISYYYSNVRVIAAMGLDVNSAVPIMSLFTSIIAASIAHKTACWLK